MKRISSVCFWLLFIIYIEMVLRVALFDNTLNLNIFYMILFLIPISLLLKTITSLFNNVMNKIVTYIMVISLTIIFTAQLVYYKTYLSIFSMFSVGKADQLLDYVDTIINIIMRNIFWIGLLFIPLIIFLIFNNKFMEYEKNNWKDLAILLISIIFFQFGAVLSLNIKSEELYSAKALYYDTHSPTISTSKLGLLTTMRLDLKRLVLGFEEKGKIDPEDVEDEKDYIEDITKPPVKIEYNRMDIDFDSLILNEPNQTIRDMHFYFNNREATKKNDYTGLFKGKNLIIFLAESFDPIAIDEEITPTLYKLYNEGFQFPNFYTPLFPVSTTDGEYITVTSLLPKEGVWSAYRSCNNYFPFVLGNSFKNIDYKTTAYHNHSASYYYRNLSHPNYGYEYIACERGLNINCKRWPESDLEMIDATYNYYAADTPYVTYYVTVSGHLRYTKVGNSMSYKNWKYVSDLDYSNSIKAYMAAQLELDRAIESLIKQLTASNELENTVIAVSSDHYPYGLTLDEINEKSSYVRDDNFEKHHSSFLLWNSNTKSVKIDKLGSSLDILPTLLNLFGVSYDSRLLMGSDLLSDSEPIVIFSNRSFITDKGKYNSITNTFESINGENVPKEYINGINKQIYDKFYLSTKILDTDYYRKVFK
ncbi:MAG: LTA synthase family protein [Bacilli bacterium]|nr:LTA synthase family protein [Bacilli bacterium]MDD4053695.1 LTA synthase family protein [Bacilli bacterium]MDD4411566.1 LTA synthase family protein [Bacilli bacterium]